MELTRRHLVKAVAASALSSAMPAAPAMPTRRLGKINFRAGILGLGAQYLGEPKVEQSVVDRVVGEAIESGVNYFDTAPPYHLSEERLGRALKGKRDRVFLVSKVETNARGDALYQIRDSLRKLQTDYLDCCHIHNISRDDRFPSLQQVLAANGTLGALLEARKSGMIRHIGCTSHLRPARVLPALETGEFDLVMLALNFVDRHTYGYEEKVIPECRKRSVGVVAMKALGGPFQGPGARLAAASDYIDSLRYVWGIAGVPVALVGARSIEELRVAVAAARNYQPLDEKEMTRITERGKRLAAEWGPHRGPVA